MPLRINEIFVKDNNEAPELLEDVLKLVTTDAAGKYYSGSFNNKEKELFLIAFNLTDNNTGDKVMKCVITMQVRDNANQIIDLDVTIPNDNLIEVEFIEKEDQDDLEESERWSIEYDSRRTYVETVNKQVLNKEILGNNLVSLSAMPYDEILIAEDMKTLNEMSGFKPQVYKWQKSIGMGDEPLSLGFGEDFVGMGMIIGKIISHKTVNIRIVDKCYEGIIVELMTGLGKLPALIPIEYEEKIKDDCYLRMMAELKADFAVGDYNYYK